MSWHFSQALVEEYLAENYLDGEQSVQLNMNHMQQLYSSSDKMMEFCNRSQSGMMCEPLTGNLGVELLTWFLAGSPVKTYHVQEEAPELKGKDQDSGRKWPGSFAKYDQNTYLWKTHQCSLFGGLVSFSGPWPRWGMMLDGELLEHVTPVRLMKENESGYWPTPMKSTAGKSEKTLEMVREGKCQMTLDRALAIRGCGTGLPNPVWVEWLMGWPMGWTDMQDLEMDKYRQWLSWHGRF